MLLDRDGTIIREKHYLSDPNQVELLSGAAYALKEMRRMGFGIIVVTNQSGIGRGYFNEETLNQIHSQMSEMLAAQGAYIDGIYYCPHTPEDNCECRKPSPGLVKQAASDFSFEPSRCFVVGDKRCDIELGRAVGATTFLVRTGYGRQEEEEIAKPQISPDYIVDDLPGVATIMSGQLQQC